MRTDLVVFGEDWGAHPSSTQHLVRHLSASRRVLWVNSIGMRRPRLNASDLARVTRKLAYMCRPAEPAARAGHSELFHVHHPRVLPWPASRAARWLNSRALTSALRERMQRQGIQRPVLWLSLPTAVDVVGRLDESATVYYCGDDFGALEGVDHAAVLAMERELADKAQLIVVSHPALAKKFPSEKIHLLPHGVDFDAFANATRVQTDAGDAPVAGFVGSIDSRLDIAALQAAVRRLPDWQFRFYGPIKTDISRLARYANVAFPGPLAAQDVAGYIKGWQVALLPYADSPMVRACNPLKLREYLAAGTPVAAIDMPALTEFRDVVEVAAPTQLADAIVAAARRNDTAARQARQSRVAQESWSQRAARVAELLHGLQVTR